MTRADDLRAAAKLLDDDLWLAGKLLAHADTIAAQESELSRLRAEVEKYRGGIHTHGPECWSWGWRHYECAERETARLRARVAELESDEPVACIVDDGYCPTCARFRTSLPAPSEGTCPHCFNHLVCGCCLGEGRVETDNNGPIVACPQCKPAALTGEPRG